ncbi:hypothetical protein BC936DRAFT_142803 [Jimgerdemannia flammicorona]|uniref:Reverse transcriptase/retrotransposon-derived protein RNase H-like domain-containing protein n=1 Tax=Jimgerdemannia flammicorona TaxID=994334 RepID=A0A433DES6_9FUNG|nr:hypothetical protein BC936DRAFT_142803 [Jimgerdemannia flammicorona]
MPIPPKASLLGSRVHVTKGISNDPGRIQGLTSLSNQRTLRNSSRSLATHPLMKPQGDLINKRFTWTDGWNNDMIVAYRNLKRSIAECAAIGVMIPDKPIIIETDAFPRTNRVDNPSES